MTTPAVDELCGSFPTHYVAGFGLRQGNPLALGATVTDGGINFAVHSYYATSVSLVLYRTGERLPYAEIPLPDCFRVGDVHAVLVYGIEDQESLEYGYRIEAAADPITGRSPDPGQTISDPYARLVAGRTPWGTEPDWSVPYQHRAKVMVDDFHWGEDLPPNIPADELVIYEAHVRGFTRHPSSHVATPGTFAGLREKLPYFKSLGINALELMPIFEFDEFENSRKHPETGEWLCNYWGYSTVSFFAPKSGYAASGVYGMAPNEFKTLVRDAHSQGIEIYLDVVFNHTAEGNENGPTIHFKGLGESMWYMLTPDGYYYNFSGTGNTLNCNHPVVRKYVVESLRYWVSEYHIDGFRFDLASILSRDTSGAPLPNPPLLQEIAYDPLIGRCKLIAEAWDAAGLYQVGAFPAYCRWAEWNGKFRDAARRFVKGDEGTVGEMATRYVGSPDLYGARGPSASVNFITAHDGFTLRDLVSYNDKHNEANGEGNRDGGNDNNSWNCGAEGETDDPVINRLRGQQMKNLLTVLLTSQGTPMILAGDERGRTQQGNNNTYCHDSELTWIDWTPGPLADEMTSFTSRLIRTRRAHPAIHAPRYHTGEQMVPGLPDLSWHGTRAWQPDWSQGSRILAVMRCVPFTGHPGSDLDVVYVAFNSHWESHEFELPKLPNDASWRIVASTSEQTPDDIHEPGQEPVLDNQATIVAAPRSAVILCAHVRA